MRLRRRRRRFLSMCSYCSKVMFSLFTEESHIHLINEVVPLADVGGFLTLFLSLSISFVHFFSLFFRESSFDAISIMHGAVGTVGGKGPPYLREALRTLLPWTLHYFLLRSHTFDQWPDRSSLGLGSAHAYKLVHCFFLSSRLFRPLLFFSFLPDCRQ